MLPIQCTTPSRHLNRKAMSGYFPRFTLPLIQWRHSQMGALSRPCLRQHGRRAVSGMPRSRLQPALDLPRWTITSRSAWSGRFSSAASRSCPRPISAPRSYRSRSAHPGCNSRAGPPEHRPPRNHGAVVGLIPARDNEAVSKRPCCSRLGVGCRSGAARWDSAARARLCVD